MVVVSILLHAEFGRNDHLEDAPHFRIEKIRPRPGFGFHNNIEFHTYDTRNARFKIRECFIALLDKERVRYQIKFHIFYLWLRSSSSGMGYRNAQLWFTIAIFELIDPLKRCCMGIWVCSILSWTRKCILWWVLSWWRSNFKLHCQLWK